MGQLACIRLLDSGQRETVGGHLEDFRVGQALPGTPAAKDHDVLTVEELAGVVLPRLAQLLVEHARASRREVDAHNSIADPEAIEATDDKHLVANFCARVALDRLGQPHPREVALVHLRVVNEHGVARLPFIPAADDEDLPSLLVEYALAIFHGPDESILSLESAKSGLLISEVRFFNG